MGMLLKSPQRTGFRSAVPDKRMHASVAPWNFIRRVSQIFAVFRIAFHGFYRIVCHSYVAVG